MTGEELRDDLHFLVDDENLSSTQELSLINQAYDRITAMRQWNFALQEDTSMTIAAGTTEYSLPSTFLYGYDEGVVIFDTSTNKEVARVKLVRMRDRLRYTGVSGYAYIDVKNSKLKFTATSDMTAWSGKTVYFTFYGQPAQLATNTSPVFNRAFHRLLALEAARFFWYNDQQTDGGFDRKMQNEYNILLQGLRIWDDTLARSIGDSFVPETTWIPEVS